MKQFDIPQDAIVVTSTYVTEKKMPILDVSHELDEENKPLWQFHCGNGDYSMEKMQLVRLDTILWIDPDLVEIADLPLGSNAKRLARGQPWSYAKES